MGNEKKILLTLLFTAVLFSGCVSQPEPECIPLEKVESAFESEGKCLVVFEGNVYDLTTISDWSGGTHKGAHSCGEEYTAEEISAGPHHKTVMDRFKIGKLCD